MRHAHPAPATPQPEPGPGRSRRHRLRAGVAALVVATLAGIGLVAVAPTSHAADINLPPTATITGMSNALSAAAADGLVYVTSRSGNDVKVYEAPLTSGATPVRTIDIGANAEPTAVAVRNGLVYVGSGNGSVSVYDAGGAGTSNDRVRNITGLTNPHGIGFDDQYMYVTCYANCPGAAGGSVSVIALSTSGAANPVRQFAVPTPVGVAVSGGEVYVSTTSGNSINVYESGPGGSNTAKRTISGGNTQLSYPANIAVADGHIIVANTTGNSVTAYKTTDAGNTAPQWRLTGSGPTKPHGLAIEGGRIYAAEWNSATSASNLVQYPLPYNPTPVRSFGYQAGPGNYTRDMVRAGNYLFWIDGGAGKITRLDVRDGTRLDLVTGISSSSWGIAVRGGYVYWAEVSKIGRVNIDGTGKVSPFISLPDANYYAHGIDVDDNYIYWTNWNGSAIGRANLDGTGINKNFITGLSDGIARISVGATHVYWADYNSNTLGRANLDGTGVNASFASATTPSAIRIDGSTLYWVSNWTIRKAQVSDMAGSTAVKAGSDIWSLSVQGDTLYYGQSANYTGSTISRVTTSGETPTTLLPSGTTSQAIGVSAPGDGYVYVAYGSLDKVYVYEAGAQGSVLPVREITHPSMVDPTYLHVDKASGLLYVANETYGFSGESVQVFLAGGAGTSNAEQRRIPTGSCLNGTDPMALTVSGGELYVTSQYNNQLCVYKAGGASQTDNTVQRAISGGSLSTPYGVEVVGDKVYVSNIGNNTLAVYPKTLSSSTASQVINTGMASPRGLELGTFRGRQLLYQANYTANAGRINGYELAANGTPTLAFTLTGESTGLSGPLDVSVDDGYIYAGGYSDGRVKVYASSPRIDSVSPTSGRPGATVTLTGKYFTGASAVRFGGASSAFTVDSDTQITATAPFMAQGKVSVEVQTGAGVTRKAEAFTYAAPDPGEDLCAAAPQLVNGSFDTDFPAVAWQRIWVDASNVPKGYKHVNTTTYPSIGWRNTAENVIELIESGANSQIADNGGQYAELNANVAGTLYQDVATTPGTTLRWSLSHRARNGDGAAAAQAGTNTMRVMIGVPGGSLVQSGSDLTSPGTSWSRHSGTYTVPAGQTTTRFAFQAVSPSGSMGNLLDNITFSAVGCAAAPTGLVATPGEGSASVAFTAGDNGGDAVTNYAYKVGSGAWTALSPADAASPVTIPDLEPGKSYTIRLRALNSTAAGLASAPVTVKMADPDANVNTWSSLAFSADGALHVATRDTGKILVFAANASGNAAPVRTITGAATGLANRPHGIAVAADGSIYVSTFDDDTIRVFAPGATGNTAPIRTISGENTGLDGPNGIALADDGTVYVASQIDKSIRVFAPGATGNAAPVRTIKGSATTLGNLRALALGPEGNLYAADTKLKVFSATDDGNTAPNRVIAGTKAGLSSPAGIAIGTDGRVYVSDRGDDAIRIFAPAAHGNIKPVRIIKGANTGLANPTSIAVKTNGTTTTVYAATPGTNTIRAWQLN